MLPTPAEHAAAVVIAGAKQLGFHRVGIIPIEAPRRFAAYQQWLNAGYAADMAYLATPEHTEPRAAPRQLLPNARSMIVVALAYHRDVRSPDSLLRGNIARYAAGEDYHMIMRDRLFALARLLSTELGIVVAARPCVDSAPVLERDAAQRAGLGFIAKNTMLIAPGLGSYVVLGELLVDLELTPTVAPVSKAHCGSCTACLDACPTKAFVDAYTLDARRCISYLTIEHRGAVPMQFRTAIGTWIFGCDICQQVCPYNAGRGEPTPAPLPPRDIEHLLPDLVRLVTFGANQLRHFVKRTALRRSPREQILRNVAIALGNSHDERAVAPLRQLLAHRHPLVRGHAAWGLGQLALQLPTAHADAIRGQLMHALTDEHSTEVIEEFNAALAASAAAP
ncbi:MAG: tRNA epoxyqueuosine(34) reductase QueG [Kofleriaceae bacterium]|nr:tRNA epoxyqueuosine(34) reductase QueG [Kofleriaceae bacterium]